MITINAHTEDGITKYLGRRQRTASHGHAGVGSPGGA
jgi:hypothetical protein